MQNQHTLYKINRDAASGHWIQVETHRPTTETHPHILFCGGFHSSMRGNKANYLVELAKQKNWAITRFDYLGHGSSDGEAEYCSMQDWLADVLAVIDSIPDELVLIGSSMGAWLATHATIARATKVKGLATIAAAPDFTETLLWPTLTDTQRQAIMNDECVTLPTCYDGDDWRIRKVLFDSGKELALLDDSAALDIRVPIRMMHGTADVDVPLSLSQRLLDRCSLSTNATLTLVSGGDHRLSDQMGLQQLEYMMSELVDACAEP